MNFRFQHFQTRLLVLFLIPLLAILTAVYFAVSKANIDNAINIISSDLKLSVGNFENAIAERNEVLASAGDALSGDFAFKQVYDTRDQASILSAMENLLGRLVLADFIAFTEDRTTTVVASTLTPEQAGSAPEWLSLIETARLLDREGSYPEAADVLIMKDRPFHTAVLPYLNPGLENWVTLGFEIGEKFTEEFKGTVSAEVTVLFFNADQWQISASTLPPDLHDNLLSQFSSMMQEGVNGILTLNGEDYVTLASPISTDGKTVEVLLQRSLSTQLQPFNALRILLLQIFAVGFVLILGCVMLISRNVTRPVRALALGARRIAEGDYQQRVNLEQQDEIGQLAKAFNGMAVGLAEKEKVRDLLGKVVSPEIANELMSKALELGGEEREVTILFSDVRGFTSLCEGQSPKQILSLLNEYFSAITAVIEAQGGVVDKYIGDAVMALFGAPLHFDDAPTRAIASALAMFDSLATLNHSFTARSLHNISIGVGINTDKVVVGNMGSQTRLNYTAIGDGVNLASRLEGLTKRYGVNIIVSEHTAKQASDFVLLELDKVRVKGKQEPVRIFEPLGTLAATDSTTITAVKLFHEFLTAYYAADFEQANILLNAIPISELNRPALLALYQERLQQFLIDPPADWDGASTYTDK